MDKKLRQWIMMAFLIALEIVLTRFLAINTAFIRISFNVLAYMIAGYFFGVSFSVMVAVVADLIGAIFFPSGPFFPGFTLSAAVSGFIYGQLYGYPLSWKRLFILVLINNIVITFLNTIWIVMMSGPTMWAYVPSRFLKILLAIPIESYVGYHALRLLKNIKV